MFGLVFQLHISSVGALAYITTLGNITLAYIIRHCHIWSRIICSSYLALKSEVASTNCDVVFTLEGVVAE